MASAAPYRSPATSPPHPPPAALPNPRKRSSAGFNPSLDKRRKQSSFSTPASAHPLRQTSFPPEESAVHGERSPSVESDVTGVTGGKSVATSARGRPTKGILKRRTHAASESVKSGPTKAGTVDGRSRVDGGGGGGAVDEAADDDDDDEQQDNGLVDAGDTVDKLAEEKKMAVLIDALNPDQADRFEAYRRQKLKKETVRRIINSTLSQSVPPAVLITINAFTKIFIGQMIERARDVQAELAHAGAARRRSSSSSSSLPTPPLPSSSTPSPKTRHQGGTAAAAAAAGGGRGAEDAMAYQTSKAPPATTTTTTTTGEESLLTPETLSSQGSSEGVGRKKKKKKGREVFLGPLLPDHFREAHRRYRRDGVGGGAGVQGVSLGLGMPGAGSARRQGRRLFK